MKRNLYYSLMAVLWLAAGNLDAANQIASIDLYPAIVCPGQSVTLDVYYCQNSLNSDSYFLTALNSSNSATLLPCGDLSQYFVVDSNGAAVSDPTPPGGWNAMDSSPVTFCRAVSWTFSIPSTAVSGSYYDLVVAGGTNSLNCGALPDSQAVTILWVCGVSPTPTPTATPTVTYQVTQVATVTPSQTPLPTLTPTPTPTATKTATFVWTATWTPPATATITPSVTLTPGGPITFVYANSDAACSAAFGCSIGFVQACRALYLDFATSYLIMRLGATCGCQVSDIMTLRLTMSWDEICTHYGLTWSTFAADLQNRISTLQPEVDTPNMLLRGAANDPSQFPITYPVDMPATVVYSAPVTNVGPVCP